jgi:hypothetical protein
MPIRPNPAPQPVHWSKDYVEHLRTVHLTLVAVSIAIIIIVVSAKPYNPAVASREIHQIIELKKLWSPQWVRKYGSNEIRRMVSAQAYKTEFPIGVDDIALHQIKRGNNPIVCIRLPKENFVAYLPFPKSVPATPTEFEGWWNELARPIVINFPYSVAPRLSSELADVLFPASPSCEEGPTLSTNVSFIWGPLEKIVYVGDSPKYPGHPPSQFALLIPRFEETTFGQKQFRNYFNNWESGDYQRAFSDLKIATREFDSLELEDVGKILDADAAKGADVFEVLGLKIPVDQVTGWGILVLLGVQIYFLLFLIQLNGKLKAKDPGWDVPWVGLDQTKFAQRMLFLTLVLLPCIAVAILGGRAISLMIADYRDPEHWWKLKMTLEQGVILAAKVLLIVGAFAAACILAAQSWKYRPQLGEDEQADDWESSNEAV